jgi:hypothetical protein
MGNLKGEENCELGKAGLSGKALLFARQVKKDQADAAHANDQEAEHDQDSQILGLGSDASSIGTAGGASEKSGHVR